MPKSPDFVMVEIFMKESRLYMPRSLPPNSEMDGDKHVDVWDWIYSMAGSHVGFGVSLGASVETRHCCPMGQGQGWSTRTSGGVHKPQAFGQTVEHCSDTDGTPFQN